MIDIFLIFGQLYPFAEVVLLTMMEFQRDGDGSGMMEEEDTPQEGKTDSEPEDKLYWYRVTGESKGNSPATQVGISNEDNKDQKTVLDE